MLIQVSTNDSEVPSWVIVELQGEVQPRQVGADLPREIGLLSRNNNNKISLVIGSHQLESARVKLVKPLALLEKHASPEASTGYKVVGVVREKYLFKSRPKPLISKPVGRR